MHTLSKKYLSSSETGNYSKIQVSHRRDYHKLGSANERRRAQVHVHDLNLIVTVQILDDTLAVLSLGKLCEEHGYTCEWTSGQKPHLTKDGKQMRCKAENCVPGVVPGLSTSSKTSSSSPSLPQDSSNSSNPACLRSDGDVSENWRKPPKTQNEKGAVQIVLVIFVELPDLH